MKIETREIAIRDIVDGYIDNEEKGCIGYRGLLNIRPEYQREFVYNKEERDGVIDSIRKNIPLNIFYWDKHDDGTYELLDGQQRTLSFCQYINGDYSIDYKYFKNQLTKEEQEQILNYKIEVKILCDATWREKLEIFKKVNTTGKPANDQEMLNASFSGPFITDARKIFSKTGCPAYNLGKNYIKGVPINQDYLHTVLDWISNGNIEDFLSKHSKDNNAGSLWDYYKNVINWIELVFPVYYREMKGLPWGKYYNLYHNNEYNSDFIVKDIKQLMLDDEVTKKSGIFEYLLSNKDATKERLLSLRAFLPGDIRTVYERQKGICPKCGKHFEIENMQGDHIIPWSKGGKTTIDNCQLLCKHCNKQLGNNG